jgi:hypothetical protein
MSDIVERLEYTAKHGLTKAADAHRYASHAEARDEIVRLNDIAMGLQTLCDQQALEIGRLRAEVEEARANSMSNWGQRERAEAAEAERDRLRDALTPSAETKAAYIGEFHFGIRCQDEDGNEVTRQVPVPWDTVKEIMAAIRARAALGGKP